MVDINIKTIVDSKEIEKIKPKLDAIKKMALEPIKFELDEEELKNFEKFKEKHGIGKCKALPDSTGACFTFSFMPTGIGMNTWVKCGCGKKEYITDLENL
ncbi:hypothetical protein LCGC14_2922800 [marine sediment metagenome]|uniref:Uncharacterized protein n=1 Tax=marine sediment metagenome TaxID=412755 RepID=A0A0F9AEB3_9ZZZZ